MMPTGQATPDLSVLIATRNRAKSLRETLTALARQETGGVFTYEVLVVDNGSTDSTRDVVKELQATFPIPLRYLCEGRPGKPFALNAGLREARGRLFAFTDDDVLPMPTWLHAFWTCFIEEGADGVAGRVLPRWVAPPPVWLTDQTAMRLGGLGCVDHGPRQLSSLQRHNCRWTGSNMAVRRKTVERIGAYDTRMIRLEDTEYYDRCIDHGLKVVYEPAALVYHKLGAERMTPEYFRWAQHTCGYDFAYFRPRWTAAHLVTVVPLRWYWQTLHLGAAWIAVLLVRRPWVERFYYELQLRRRLSLWLHRLQLWPRWWVTMLRGRS